MNHSEQVSIHSFIHDRRKELGYTQEELAQMLGVSTPAVSKWESSSYPDITLLSPLARALKTDVNTLLNFRKTLSREEVGLFLNELNVTLRKDGYQAAVSMADSKLLEYPDSGILLHSVAMFLDGALIMSGLPKDEKEAFQERIFSMYERAAATGDPEIHDQALYMLASKYTMLDEFTKAQNVIDQLPSKNALDKNMLQANLYTRENKPEAAAGILEKMLFSHLNDFSRTLMLLVDAEISCKNMDAAEKLANSYKHMVKDFSLWDYNAYPAFLSIAVAKEDVSETIDLIRHTFDAMLVPWTIDDNCLWLHMKKKSESLKITPQEQKKDLQQTGLFALRALITELTHDSKYAFLSSHKEFQDLVTEYKCLLNTNQVPTK